MDKVNIVSIMLGQGVKPSTFSSLLSLTPPTKVTSYKLDCIILLMTILKSSKQSNNYKLLLSKKKKNLQTTKLEDVKTYVPITQHFSLSK